VFNNGAAVSDGDTLTDVLPAGTTFVSFSTTNGNCTSPNVGSGGTFKCMRSGVLNKGSYWGPITLTIHVNALSGATLRNTANRGGTEHSHEALCSTVHCQPRVGEGQGSPQNALCTAKTGQNEAHCMK
jgi:hypothetical protein